MTFIKRGSAAAVCFSHFCLYIVLEGRRVFMCVWGNNLIAELNPYLLQHWHLQQAEKSSSPNFYELWNKNKPSADTVTQQCESKCDTFALHISSENKLLSKDRKQPLKWRQ